MLPLTTEYLTTGRKTPTTKRMTTSTGKITTPTKKILSTIVKKTTPNREITTLTQKINSTEKGSTNIPFVTQITKSDNDEGTIAALGTIAGVSLIANVILSILLFRSCRRVSVGYDTTPIYGNENVSNTDQTEMYSGLDFKEDRCAYQTLTRLPTLLEAVQEKLVTKFREMNSVMGKQVRTINLNF
uniref:Uncharacterized protein n=1 Tax=Magallana gigas TaxID=29159 RepID=K1PQH2_MAGGI